MFPSLSCSCSGLRALAGLLLMGGLLSPGCNGTDAGNPFTEIKASLCKGEEEYRVIVGEDASAPQLGDLRDIPVWLECVETRHEDGRLSLQIANFRGSCAVDWVGSARVEGEEGASKVVVDLENESCSVAKCGNCLYDLVVDRALPLSSEHDSSPDLEVSLVRRDCKGQVVLESSYPVRPGAERSSFFCRPADSWGIMGVRSAAPEGAELDLYAPCGAATGEDSILDSARVESCAEGLVCSGGRCVTPCEDDSDCPLPGAERCVEDETHGSVCQLIGAE